MAAVVTEIPTTKRVRNQSSTPFRTVRHVLESDVAQRYAEYASLYYSQHNWIFSGPWAVWTPQREEIDAVERPGTRYESFQSTCNALRNTACVHPVELTEPVTLEAYVDQKFIGTPGKPDRKHVENWISYEAYPVAGADPQQWLSRKFVDSIRKLSGCRRPQWWQTEHKGIFHATDPGNGNQLIGIVAAIGDESAKRKR